MPAVRTPLIVFIHTNPGMDMPRRDTEGGALPDARCLQPKVLVSTDFSDKLSQISAEIVGPGAARWGDAHPYQVGNIYGII
jgi:hypothetical protein